MGRPSSPESRTNTVSVKVTRQELRALAALNKGSANPSPGRGLRRLIDQYLGRRSGE